MVNCTKCSALLFFALFNVLLMRCHGAPVEVGRSPISSVSKTLRLVTAYANPFVWIGTPTLPKWANRRRDQVIRKKPARKRYRWAIEVDADNRWWIAVYENDPNNPGSATTGRRTVWQF